MSCSTKTTNIFDDAIKHSRQKTIMINHIETMVKPNIQGCKGRTYEEIVDIVYKNRVKGIGRLGVYDLSNGICRYHCIKLDKVYIEGPGPRRAIKLLGISAKTHYFNNYKMKYVEISEVIQALEVRGVSVPKSSNGDDYETYLCIWQKTNS